MCYTGSGHRNVMPAAVGPPPAALLRGVTYPPSECPYSAPEHPFGQIINVGERFKDHCIRLVRDLALGTPAWKRIYHRARNASEGRNATLASWGFKRLTVYGQPRSRAFTSQGDVWLYLTALARLVREATAATGNS